MNINSTKLSTSTDYSPLSNTPPVCFTQDLPPEHQNADILLLGCGDAKNILFTCFADQKRTIDVTCCDIEAGIHARNILLYTLLIDDKADLMTNRIWNIYFHWKLDRQSSELLKTQLRKLSTLSESVDLWEDSVYGSSIRFCDERSLFSVRCYWLGFSLKRLEASGKDQSQDTSESNQEKSSLKFPQKDQQEKWQDVIDRAKRCRGENANFMTILHPIFPVLDLEAINDRRNIANHWREHGAVPSSTPLDLEPVDLNPTFMYSSNPNGKFHICFPLEGFPLSSAYTQVAERSAFFLPDKTASSTEHLVACAKNHFAQWARAFRKSIGNKSVIRIFSGDALSFCFALRNCQLTRSTSMNLFCQNWSTSPLTLNNIDYGCETNAAPLSFDVIDTSSLAETLGPLNVMTLSSSLLKYHASSSLYTEALIHYDADLPDRLSTIFGVDVRCMSLFLGLVTPDLYTNASNKPEVERLLMEQSAVLNEIKPFKTPTHTRIHWKRIREHQIASDSPFLKVEATALAKFLVQTHNAMFRYENPNFADEKTLSTEPHEVIREVARVCNPSYNRASFVLLLRILKANIISDWSKCIEDIYNALLINDCLGSREANSALDLILNMHVFGVDSSRFPKITPEDLSNAILAPILPGDNLPDMLCVTVRVRREYLGFLTNEPSYLPSAVVTCTFEGKDPEPWSYVFSSIQCTFGEWHEQVKDEFLCPYIDEDTSKLFGTSDMFISVMVPTSMLARSKQFVPLVKCGILPTTFNYGFFNEALGPDLIFTSCDVTSEDVFITRFMPGLTASPLFHAPVQNDSRLEATVVQLTDDGSKIKSLVSRVTLQSEGEKLILRVKSTKVKVTLKSPWTAIINIGIFFERKLEFPVPVSIAKYKVRVARTSSYVEVESPILNPLEEKTAWPLFPIFLSKLPSGTTVPVPWSSKYIDLDAMPQLDIRDKHTMSWLKDHCIQMFSTQEAQIRNVRRPSDARTKLKNDVFDLFMCYTGMREPRTDIFFLNILKEGILMFIYPSCLRLDLTNHTVVFDCALISAAAFEDENGYPLLREIGKSSLTSTYIEVSGSEIFMWEKLIPALVERGRDWKHTSDCAYVEAGEVLLYGNSSLPVCCCGVGKFPVGYLEEQSKTLPSLKYVLDRYAVRTAISPIFAVPYVEMCGFNVHLN